MWFWDIWYFIFLAPGILLGLWAQWRIHSAFRRASEIAVRSGYSGAEAAAVLLDRAGIRHARIEASGGFLSDHYVPGEAVLRLSPDVYASRSLAAVAIAAHETGHAFQDAQRYPLLVMRNSLVPLAGVGSNLSWILLLIGFVLMSLQPVLGHTVIIIGIALFSLTVVFQLVNLPVEFDASRRARVALVETGIVTREEDHVVADVLKAAALTYVAATLTSVLTLLYFLFRSGLLGGRN
jgi:Zn-dependent membrane protease YugP